MIELTSPLAGSAKGGGLIVDNPLGDDQVDLVVQYEYVPTTGDVDGMAVGGRVQTWVDDRLQLGFSAQTETTGVADNQLSGPLPSFSGLTALRRVDASNNQLSGTIPNLDGLPALLFFLVDHNQLSGTPPPTPASLLDTGSMLCPNLLHAPSPSDTLWNNATAGATWFADCTRGYLVTASATAGGSISPSQGVADGGTATFAITPQAGQEVDSVISACGGTRTGNSFTTDPVRADCSLTVSFRAAAVPVPTLGQWALMVLGLLLAGLGARRVRQRGA